ncbi:HU family DNA-binding protein [Parabacteroides sp. PF5-6]|uniref:HU family DNA-binding protein n=1 Tax=Parabacteroides sp. PF5-6 TaxID=1742403 RepID=UPI002406990B|nr:HU family DNA-binding protein [Parabacteroides sp. PF5-6]MDF9829900.1 putative histone-like DNA-binding protein [Parabacteroides sp. PF5-6]
MSLHYDLYENPLPDGNRRKRLHARVVTRGTTNTEDLAYLIHDRCSLTPGDVKAALSELADVLAHELKYGKRVHLEGLGYFQLTLDMPPVRDPKDIRAGSIQVKSIAFRPEIGFKERFTAIDLKRVREKNHSTPYSAEQIDQKLETYFQTHPHITGQQFQFLFHMTRTTAYRRIKQLVAEGKLQKIGHRRSPLYVKKED